MLNTLPIIAVVTRETRLEGLKARWATASAAAFRMKQAVGHEVELRKRRMAKMGVGLTETIEDAVLAAGAALADESEYESEDEVYQRTVGKLMSELDLGYPVKRIDRTFLPNFDFGRCVLVVVIGQDGLVANTAKYVGDLPIVAINPDPARNDGVLLPFEVGEARNIVRRVLDEKAKTREITLAEVNLNDGQRMLAFNDFFVGCSSHISARYTLEDGHRFESQSSSGVLVSTGAGSTGWLSSLFNMAEGICRFAGGKEPRPVRMQWEDRRLAWAVREPFRSKHSSANLVAGFLDEGSELVIGSQMPLSGVIFSDGVESDFLEFNSGSIARFTVSMQAPTSLWSDESLRNQDPSDRERAIIGSILGTAVGDAIGLPYEGLSPRRARRLLGSPDRHRFLFGHGMVSDDTEHVCLVAQALIASGSASGFAHQLTRRLRIWLCQMPAGVGLATLRACLKLNLGFSWHSSGVHSAGNGPAMRSAILGATIDDLELLQTLVTITSRITHTDPRAEHGALAIALAAREAGAKRGINPCQFLANFQQLCSKPTAQELLDRMGRAAESYERGDPCHLFASSIGMEGGITGYINHTVPIVLHAWWSHPTDFRAAVEAVVVCGGDADTTAAIVGGIVGTAVGKDGIPTDWLRGIWEWPRSIEWMEKLGGQLARDGVTQVTKSPPNVPYWGVLTRNAFFAAVVITHGFRRLLPPY